MFKINKVAIFLILYFSFEQNVFAQQYFDFSGISNEKFVFAGSPVSDTRNNAKLMELLLVGIEISVANIVNVNTTLTYDQYMPYKYQYLIVYEDFSFQIMEKEKYKLIYDPVHPDAIVTNDELLGCVRYPDIDIACEYSDILAILNKLRELSTIEQ
jgi:hypothetical protein